VQFPSSEPVEEGQVCILPMQFTADTAFDYAPLAVVTRIQTNKDKLRLPDSSREEARREIRYETCSALARSSAKSLRKEVNVQTMPIAIEVVIFLYYLPRPV